MRCERLDSARLTNGSGKIQRRGTAAATNIQNPLAGLMNL
jgi:hypothetical protein